MSKGALKTLIATALVLLLAGYVYVFEFKKGQSEEKQKDLETLLLPNVAADQVTHIEWWTGPNKTITVDKKDGVWTLTALHPQGSPDHALTDQASSEQIQSFLSKLLQARATDTVVQGVFDEKTFGLDMPLYEIKLSGHATKLRGLRVGSIKAYDASLYTQTDDDRAVRLAPNSLTELFKKTSSELREKNLYREPPTANWTEITVTKENKKVLALKRKDSAWVSEDNAALKIDAALVSAYLKRIENIKAVDFTFEGAGPKELKAFRLDSPYILVELKGDKDQAWELRLSAAKTPASDVPAGAMQVSVVASATHVAAIAKILDTNLKIIDKRADDFVAKPKSSPAPLSSPKAPAAGSVAPKGSANGI